MESYFISITVTIPFLSNVFLLIQIIFIPHPLSNYLIFFSFLRPFLLMVINNLEKKAMSDWLAIKNL